LRQIRFITRYLKKFLRMRVVERPYPISHGRVPASLGGTRLYPCS
jgi:hypothetical protein